MVEFFDKNKNLDGLVVNLKAYLRRGMVFAALAALSIGGYLVYSAWNYGVGFPLDDAWIHQTYARNLALLGEWSFVPEQPSAGSTGPLWAALLAVGHALGLGPYIWTYALGWLSLAGLGMLGALVFEFFCPSRQKWHIWAGALLIFEWHLVWAAASGMETILFSLFCMAVLLALLVAERRSALGKEFWFSLGALVGFSVWARPDGITLLGPVILYLVLQHDGEWRKTVRQFMMFSAGFGIIFIPYLFFNVRNAGAVWPNTFYAKQAEYAILRSKPYVQRWLDEAALPLIGVGAMLLPGFFYEFWQALRTRRWPIVAAGLWTLGFLSIYAWRLPVTFQYGRYVIPVMPVYFVLGLSGLVKWAQPQSERLLARVVSRAWVLISLFTAIGFWWMGVRIYARDVEFIESEMVTVARWVAANTASDDLIAAHDIGALGYFGGRKIVDLAGLISPEVIPFIRDESQLEAYLNQQSVDVLVTFPGWYPALSTGATLRFQTDAPLSKQMNYENMAVYTWNIP